MQGFIFDIQRFAIHDGAGIRTNVFMKGCPLRCIWCHNPEGISPNPQLMYFEYKCIHCYTCVNVCPQKAIYFDDHGIQKIKMDLCKVDNGCRVCDNYCPTTATKIVGRFITVEELVQEVMKDANIYEDSGGGVTFTGGEPLFQPQFLKDSLKNLKEKYIHTAIETSGYASREVVKSVEPFVDLFLHDIKLFDEEEHKKYTGVSNQIIKENLKFLVKIGRAKDIYLRFPIIPGITDTDHNIEGWVKFIEEVGGFQRIHILPFHDVSEKYKRLRMPYLMPSTKAPSEEKLKEIEEKFEEIGLEVVRGG